LRIILAAMARVTLVLGVTRMHFGDLAADVTGFGIPAHVVADLEDMTHHDSPEMWV
jgi:hypothetical protein